MAEEDNNEDILTYEKDIMPLRKSYFENLSGSKIDPLTRARMSEAYGKELLTSFSERAKAQEMSEVNKNRRLQFETTKLALEQAREDAASKRNMLQAFQPFQQEVDSILNDSTIDSAERKRRLGITGVRNAPLLATNEAAAKAYGAAQLGVGEEEKKKLTVFDYVRSGGDTKFLSEINPDVTKVDINQEINPAWMLDRLNKSAVAKERAAADVKSQRAQQKKSESLLTKTLEDIGTIQLAEQEYGKEGVSADTFKDPSSEYKAISAIEFFGTPEEKEKFNKTTSAKQRLQLVQQAGLRQVKSGVVGQAPTRTTASSLFTSTKPKPEPTISPFVNQ
jgi:hypothetical protein